MSEKRKHTLLDFFSRKKISGTSRETATTSSSGNVNDEQQQIIQQNRQDEHPSSEFCSLNAMNMDISNFINKHLSDEDKIRVLKNVWTPAVNFDFPLRASGKQNRKFSYGWLTKYNWLAYSKSEDSVYCKMCVLFANKEVGMTSSQSTGQLITVGFNTWKKALKRFDNHESCQYHKFATLKCDNFLKTMSGQQETIDKSLDIARSKQAEENRRKIKPIIKTIILCGRQGLPLRGHKDYGPFDLHTEPKENEGTFRAILRARVDAGDCDLKNHLQTCGLNATYISWNMQNQIIAACGEIIKQKIVTEVNSARCFSVLADETTDISTVEQLTLCVRYVKNFENSKSNNSVTDYRICEQFLQFTPAASTKGEDLAKAILHGLEECLIETHFLRGQGYDGAASMSGSFRGTQAIINNKYPKALYVHCVSHSLNLALSNAAEVPSIRNCFGIIEKIYAFFNTPKRQLILQKCVSNLAPDEAQKHKLKQLCPTRWVQRHDAVLVMVQLLPAVAAALEEIKSWEDKDSSSNASLLLNSLEHSEFIISLLCSEKLLGYTLVLSKVLQTVNIDLVSVINLASNVEIAVNQIRENSEQEFYKIFKIASSVADSLGVSIALPRITKKQVNRSNIPADNAEVYYRRSIFIPWLDSFLANIRERFCKHRHILKGFMCLLPSGSLPSEVEKEQFLNIASYYQEDLDCNKAPSLTPEFELWYQKFKDSNEPLPRNAIDALNACNKDIYSNIFILLKTFATLPVSTSTAERSFSTLRRIKTYLRNTMGENRLNGLAHLNIHREILVDPDEVISVLQRQGVRRLNFVL